MNRIKALSLIMVFFLLITVAGLIFVQVFMYEKYKAMSEDNRLKIVPLPAPRGGITDRNGEDLVKDEL
ncbi:MAG TPA: penicillin-binding protein 2, partial [Candidatus Omnitrophota bacterium]|nr:penicillin-binding protein 2 [Candidatus Omnitrophota bacterium]